MRRAGGPRLSVPPPAGWAPRPQADARLGNFGCLRAGGWKAVAGLWGEGGENGGVTRHKVGSPPASLCSPQGVRPTGFVPAAPGPRGKVTQGGSTPGDPMSMSSPPPGQVACVQPLPCWMLSWGQNPQKKARGGSGAHPVPTGPSDAPGPVRLLHDSAFPASEHPNLFCWLPRCWLKPSSRRCFPKGVSEASASWGCCCSPPRRSGWETGNRRWELGKARSWAPALHPS